MQAIQCEGLSKAFGKFVALDHLDLGVPAGAIFGFLGPNGAGKTTTLRLLAGLTRPSAGKVWVNGKEVSGNSLELRSAIGYLPESPAYYNWMTGREFLWFTAELYGLDRQTAGRRAGELLERVNLQEAAERRIKGYSRGMQQRLGLAQALMNRPKVLLLDEPASALDPMGRREMLETINALRGQTTVFLSTHILGDVERVCDTVGIVRRGKLLALGSIAELRAKRQGAMFEVECEQDMGAFAAGLASVPWVKSAQIISHQERRVLQVQAGDMEKAKGGLPRLVADSGLTLLRYQLVVASLEDIFVDIIGGQEHRP